MLAEAENLQNHVTRQYEPLVECDKQQSVKHIQLSGSLSECLFLDSIIHADSRKLLYQSDMDYISFFSQELVYTSKSQTAVGLVLDTYGCSPGYCRIKQVPSTKYIESSMFSVPLGSPSQDVSGEFNYKLDLVPCFCCSDWDVGVDSIFRSPTARAWPTPQLLREIKSTKILLVHKVDPARRHEHLGQYFRFSFSLVEKSLCRSLPHCFRYIYLCTKLILKHFCSRTELKSYFVKTTLFHFLTESFNNQEKFLNVPIMGVIMLIEKLQKCFRAKRLPNFFVPDMNMLVEVELCDIQRVEDILGDILSRLEAKILEMGNALKVLDYR